MQKKRLLNMKRQGKTIQNMKQKKRLEKVMDRASINVVYFNI